MYIYEKNVYVEYYLWRLINFLYEELDVFWYKLLLTYLNVKRESNEAIHANMIR